MTFRGKDTYKTNFGGIMSFITYALILTYLIFSFLSIKNNKHTVSGHIIKNDVIHQPGRIELDSSEFQVAVKVVFMDEFLGIKRDPDLYFRVMFGQA